MADENSARDKSAELDDLDAFARPADVKRNRADRRLAKIRSEIDRNRRGEYTVPTWVLTALLLLIIAGFAAIIIFAG